MSARRLGTALARHILALPGRRKFVIVEGLGVEVAEAVAAAWNDDQLQLVVASAEPHRFGRHGLDGQSGTAFRNQDGVCVLACENAELPDSQSLRALFNVSPDELLASLAGLTLLSQVEPAAPLDGPSRHVRSAIVQAGPAARPSALAVAAYLDAVAAGGNPLQQLPLLGAFADHAADRVDAKRILANFALAASRRDERAFRPADLRRRAERILAQRPGLDPAGARRMAERVIAMLQSGDDELLRLLTFDEAVEILDQRASDLPTQAARQVAYYRQTRGGQDDVAWERYEDAARDLRDRDRDCQKDAARDLLGFDQLEGSQVFEPATRRRLEQLLKDRVVSASRPSCPEAALLGCAKALGSISAIELVEPRRGGRAQNRTAAVQELALACSRLRLGRLLRNLQEDGVAVDGALLLPAAEEWPGIFEDAKLNEGPGVAFVQLRVRSPQGASRLISWRPDLDDVAALRAALAFAEQPALTLQVPGVPTLASFCSGPTPEPLPVADGLVATARALQRMAQGALEHGLSPEPLEAWAEQWREAVRAEREAGRTHLAEALALAGAVQSGPAAALTALAPLKAEWLAQYLDALWSMTQAVQALEGAADEEPYEETAAGIARATAAHYPAHLRLRAADKALLPTGEGRLWSLYGAGVHDTGQLAGEAIAAVITRLLTLQPDAAGHLRCLAYGPGSGTILVEQAIAMSGRKLGRARLGKVELFCVEDSGARPSARALAAADEKFAAEPDRPLEIRYLPDLATARQLLGRHSPGAPAVHVALVTGLTAGGGGLQVNTPDVDPPPPDPEVLFAPRTWARPRATRRMLLMPPGATPAGLAWLELMNAVEDAWPDPGGTLTVPELRTGSGDIREPLLAVHDLALWVATLDPYASRDSLTYALDGEVAILHQDRRLAGDSALSLVISQKAGGPVDRAVGRSLLGARIVGDLAQAVDLGEQLRRVASEGYGVLALEAATTGAGINELVGHVVAFSMLATRTTPWPLPPGCRVLLVSLDDYKHWFPAKRADLLVLALDTSEKGVHAATIEVKARFSDAGLAARDAVDQLRHSLNDTRYAAQPQAGLVHSRLWLNRLAEAACAVARESNFRLTADELEALDRFRRGHGTLEWAGLGLVFGPTQPNIDQHYHHQIDQDRIPLVIHSVQLTEALLREASSVNLPELRTVEAERAPLGGGRIRRRPERADIADPGPEPSGAAPEPDLAPDGDDVGAAGADVSDPGQEPSDEAPEPAPQPEPDEGRGPGFSPGPAHPSAGFVAPILGWDMDSGEPLLWRAAGPDAELDNGHTEIWGASGSGKTQFTMSLLAQLADKGSAKFGVADFKNDYGDQGEDRFPSRTGSRFLDLWTSGAPFNPLALPSSDPREADKAIIELRDIVAVAAQSFTTLGHRQKQKLQTALERAYEVGLAEDRWPTMLTLNDQLDEDLRGVIGDLTRYEIFREGPPLGDAITENLVFGLQEIPGNGLTTVLAAGFILSALQLRISSLPQAANTIRYIAVVDEAHRVAAFKAVKQMLQEGRSKGLAVVLATQQPGDLPAEVAANVNTRVCFRLPDATIAAAAARRLSDTSLTDQIRTLERGEALVSFAGRPPQLLRMAQYWRDRPALGLPEDEPAA